MALRLQQGTPINFPQPAQPPGGTAFLNAAFQAGNSLNIRHVYQWYSLWCWAACAEMILTVFDEEVDKCRIASRMLGQNCCTDGDPCNTDWAVEEIHEIVAEWGISSYYVPNRVGFSTIKNQIDNWEMPLELFITWGEGYGGHVLIADGWRQYNNQRYVKIKDPWFGPGEVRLSDLIYDYSPDSGQWVGTWYRFQKE